VSEKPHILDEQIIAFVCGAMSREERATLASRMVDDAELASRVEAVRRTLAPLEAWRAPEPAPGAVDAIMERVGRTTPLTYVAETSKLAPVSAEGESGVRRSRFTLAQFFAVAASIAILLSVLFPTIRRVDDSRLQTACLSGMKNLGAGVMNYAAAYDGAMPRVHMAQPANWLSNPQREHYAPAIRLRFVAPRDLFCPSTGTAVDDETVRKNLEAFFQRTDVRFYTIQHPAGGPTRLGVQFRRMPIAGDENPMFPQGAIAPDADDTLNSPAHRGHGQNVLFSDGSASFLRSPQLPDADNIWRAENTNTYQGTETPVSATDSFLIP